MKFLLRYTIDVEHSRQLYTGCLNYSASYQKKEFIACIRPFAFSENGQLLTSNLMDYALPHSHDVPNISTVLVEIPSDLGPFGAKGVGEPPVVPVGVEQMVRDA